MDHQHHCFRRYYQINHLDNYKIVVVVVVVEKESTCVASFVADEAAYVVDAFFLFVDAYSLHVFFVHPIIFVDLVVILIVVNEVVLVDKNNLDAHHIHQVHRVVALLPLLHFQYWVELFLLIYCY